jgi:magnesium chelatase family protein
MAARERQHARHDGRYRGNAHLDSTATRKHCAVGSSGKALLESALERMGLSARAYDKILRVARTLADLDDQESIGDHHLAEAIQYRSLEREMF